METTPDPAPAETGATSSGKADLGKRFLALLIDGLIVMALSFILGMAGRTFSGLGLLIGAAYILLRDGLALEFMNGRSIGKKVMKLRPIRLDGGIMDINTSIRRNWPLVLSSIIMGIASVSFGIGMFAIAALLGIIGWIASLLGLVEAILVLTDSEGRRIGDKFAGTKVIVSDD
ncbi:MAG: RDD family protein [Bacteroidetes bacterium]|nr:RDD family protein [Bacteroidota bacterium]